MSDFLRVGTVLHGFCGGAFGRDFWGPARVEGIGADWVVARDENGVAWFASGNPDSLLPYRSPGG